MLGYGTYFGEVGALIIINNYQTHNIIEIRDIGSLGKIIILLI